MSGPDSLHCILSPREIRILSWYFYDGATQSEIAEEVGLSQQGVGLIIERATSKLVEAGYPAPIRRHSGLGRDGERPVVFTCDPFVLDTIGVA